MREILSSSRSSLGPAIRLLALATIGLLAALGCGADGEAPAEGSADASMPEDGGAAAADAPSAPAAVEIREWEVPWPDTRPRDPYVAPDGRVWFVGQRADYLGTLDPTTGEFERIELASGAAPHNLVVGDDGTVWYAGNGAAHIGIVGPETREIETVPMPDPAARDPHTLVFDPSGDLWFTVQGGNFVGRLDTETREVRLVAVPVPDARPYGIVVDAEGRPWIAEFGVNRIATVDPRTMKLSEHELPRAEARPRRIAIGEDGGVWYVDYAEGYLGRLDPASGEVREWRMPSGPTARPYAMAADSAGRIWFVETAPDPNRLVGFDVASEEFLEATPIPSGGGVVRHMVFHEPGGAIWFGTDVGTIGRALLPD